VYGSHVQWNGATGLREKTKKASLDRHYLAQLGGTDPIEFMEDRRVAHGIHCSGGYVVSFEPE